MAAMSNKPLYDTSADTRAFVAPRGWESLFRWVHAGYHTLLSGAPGSGRTSTLRQLQLRLRESGARVAFVDAPVIEDVGDLLAVISQAIAGQPGTAEVLSTRVARVRDLVAGTQPGAATTAGHDILASWRESGPQVVLLDAPGSGRAVYELFGRLRDDLWQLELIWVAAVNDADTPLVLRPPADAFFDQTLRLDRRSNDELTQMLQVRGADPELATTLAEAAEGNPRRALSLARDALGGNLYEIEAQQRRLAHAAALGDSHRQMQLALEDLGSASASDPALLQRLAVSRPRAQVLLADLADAGLVQTDSAQPTGKGRPRKLFRPATDHVPA